MGTLLGHRGEGVQIQYISPILAIGSIGGVRYADPSPSVQSGNPQIWDRSSDSVFKPGTRDGESLRRILEETLAETQHPRSITGDYAAAWIDESDGAVVLARDRFGRQPLYWSKSRDRVAFASEYKAILALSDMRFEPDPSVILAFQTNGFVVPNRCFPKTVHPVPCGGVVRISTPSATPVALSPPPRRPVQVAKNNSTEGHELIELLSRSVVTALSHTADDEPFAIALSGGVDSSLLVALTRRLFPDREIHTFTVGYSDSDPEIVGALETAREFGTTHHEVLVTPDDVAQRLEAAVWQMEDPIGHDEYPCLFLLAEAIDGCRRIKTVLIGNGSDGLFAGMPAHKNVEQARQSLALRRNLEAAWAAIHHRPGTGAKERHSASTRLLDEFSESFRVCGIRDPAPQPCITVNWDVDPVGDFLWHNIVNYDGRLAGQTNLFAAFGLRAEMPYLDARVVEFALTLPPSRRFGPDGQNKFALREAARLVLPDEIRSRPKGIQHLKRDVAFADTLDDLRYRLLGEPADLRLFSKVDLSSVDSWRTKDGYVGTRFERLWNILVAEIWARLFLNEQLPPPRANGSK